MSKNEKTVRHGLLVLLCLLVLLLPATAIVLNPRLNMNEPTLNLEDDVTATKNAPSSIPVSATRGGRTDEIEPNDVPANAKRISTIPTDVNGQISSETDVDWFYVRLEVQEENDKLTHIENLSLRLNTIIPNPLTGDPDHYLGISIYGWFDINQDSEVDYDNELIFMNMTRYRLSVPSSSAFHINGFNDENYYIKFETDGATADYHFRLNLIFNEVAVNEDNQNIQYADSYTTPSTHQVDMDTDAFDWFSMKKSYIPVGTVGRNFSLKVQIDDYLSKQSVTLKNGTTINFVSILHILVYHEADAPGDQRAWQYRTHLKLSRHSYTGYKYRIEYSDVITLPTSLFKETYLGFFVESYGLNPKKPEIKYYPIIEEMVEYARDTFCVFTIEESKIENINRPELTKVTVISQTTNSIYGRTYDEYLYSVVYSQEDNNPPLTTDLSVFGTEGEVRRPMREYQDPTKPIPPNSVKYIEGMEYRITISGRILDEGDHHVFQFHFKDKNTYANGSVELGKTWHGPYISDNIRPYVRPTAPTNLTLYEDDETTYFDLNSIFEDVDLKEQLNFTITDPEKDLKNRVWGKSYSNSILDVNIINNTQLKIDLKPNANGEVKILLNVTDKMHYYLDPEFEFIIKVLPVNDAPQIIQYFSHIILLEDEVNTEINLGEYFVDLIDNELLTYRAENFRNVNVEIAQDSNVKLTPEPDWFGVEYIDFFASDGEEEVTDFLKVIVKSVNDVPKISINHTLEFFEDAWANFTINATDSADGEEVIISHNLTYIFPELERNPGRYGYTFNNKTGYFTLKPTNYFVGTYSWNISAVDVNNNLNFTHITLIIHNINDPPVPEILYPKHGARFLTTDKISFRGQAYDPDSELKDEDLVWYSSLGGVLKKIGTGPTLNPQLYKNGTHRIILTVSDEEFIINSSILMNVYSINQDLDTDEDGIPDYWENLYYLDIRDPHDAEDDYDKDTYSNWEEFMADTDPRDPKSMPDMHYTKEKETTTAESSSTGIIAALAILIIIILMVIFLVIRRRKKQKAKTKKEHAAGSTEGIIGMTTTSQGGQGPGIGKYKTPTVICHRCGKSLKVMTLNRPVVLTCTDCGARGAVY